MKRSSYFDCGEDAKKNIRIGEEKCDSGSVSPESPVPRKQFDSPKVLVECIAQIGGTEKLKRCCEEHGWTAIDVKILLIDREVGDKLDEDVALLEEEDFAVLRSASDDIWSHRRRKTLADSLDQAVRPEDPYFNKLLRILSTRCTMPAQYFCSGEIPKDQWHHYGLAAPVYTHFTSPIRRYADVLVHRLLAATIGVIALPAANADRTRQQELCTHMNRRHRAAQYAQRASVNLHTIAYFRQRPALQEAAYVLSVKEDSFNVLVPRFGIEGTLRWDEIKAALGCDGLHFDAAAHSVTLTRAVAAGESAKASKKQKKSNETHGVTLGQGGAEVMLQLRVFDRVHISIKVDEGSGNGGDRKLIIALVHQDRNLAEVVRDKERKSELSAGRMKK